MERLILCLRQRRWLPSAGVFRPRMVWAFAGSWRTASGGAPYDLHGGFWFQNLAPTAAAVSITGRVFTSSGQGIRNARLILTSPDGARRTAITTTFGYYAFDGVEVGHTYVLEIAAKKHTFANPTRVFSLQDHVTDMDFHAQPN